MKKSKLFSLLFFGGSIFFTNFFQNNKTDNYNYSSAVVRKNVDKKLNTNFSNNKNKFLNKYFDFLKKNKYVSKWQNVALFKSENNENLLFNSLNNNYVNVFNDTTKSSFSLYFLDDNFLINQNIENNYKYLINVLNTNLDLKDTKNYDENIQNFIYQSDNSFAFNGSVVSKDKSSQRQFNGVVKDKNLIIFKVDYFDFSHKKLGWLEIFGIIVFAILTLVMIVFGLYEVVGAFGVTTGAIADGAGAGAAGAEDGVILGVEGEGLVGEGEVEAGWDAHFEEAMGNFDGDSGYGSLEESEVSSNLSDYDGWSLNSDSGNSFMESENEFNLGNNNLNLDEGSFGCFDYFQDFFSGIRNWFS
ncbi:hypothetical protein JTY60_01840 [symbiont of Argiope bruennichi]|uniref:hypothetical protein n=1 Tax=symbiont of Argiope bruennichi TaxID=2810479 RepID=UPI003DA481D1